MNIELEDSLAAGDLGIFHLKRLWSRSIRDRLGLEHGGQGNEWALDNVIYHGLNLPIEETIRFLYQDAPTFAEFENWVRARNGSVIHQNAAERINAAITGLLSGERPITETLETEQILTADDLAFWNDHGYLVVSNLFSRDEVKDAEDAVWDHLRLDPNDAETWYRRSSDHGIMVQFFHHPALDAIRHSFRLRSVFAQLWGTSELWVSTDRVSFNPPERSGHEFPGPHLHWDVSLDPPIPFGIQGLIYLTDTAPDQGAFTCVPGFHTRIESWLESLPAGSDPRTQDIEALGATPIPGKAGDLVIWHQALPHGSRPNRASRPRIVEYVTMFPSDAAYAQNWK
jgi:ectoine hydroxylase-related dioxygenase (phytanoyl-CoA dioxygenase family)